MLNIYLVRHGQTEWNIERRFQGWLDSPLTEQGIGVARELGEKIAHMQFNRCISSTSERAMKTMSLILPSEMETFETDPRLREICLGPWQGMTHEVIEELYPEQLRQFYMMPELFKLQDAETYWDVMARIEDFLTPIISATNDDEEDYNILIVTHGITLMLFQLIFDGNPLSELPRYSVTGNASVHHFQRMNGQFVRVDEKN